MNRKVAIIASNACPMPIVKAKMELDTLESGQTMEMLSTDKGSIKKK